jgi:hypothetical protein
MDDLDTELSILEEKLADQREESTRWKSFQSPTPVTTRIKDRVRDSDVSEAHFSEEFQYLGESHRSLTVYQASIRKPLQKSLQDNISETHIETPEPC